MLSEIDDKKIIAHIAGINQTNKVQFHKYWKKSILYSKVNIVDLEIITDKIYNDDNMCSLFEQYEKITQGEAAKKKLIEKQMMHLWKAKMEFFILKALKSSKLPIILIGYISYYKDHKIYIDLKIVNKFFIKCEFDDYLKKIITYNLDNNREFIINGTFDLNNLDKNFIMKRRLNITTIYKKISYIFLSMNNIINSIELSYQIAPVDFLFFSSLIEYKNKKINLPSTIDGFYYTCYTDEWIALTSIQKNTDNEVITLKKSMKNKKTFVELPHNEIIEYPIYMYQIDASKFVPFPTHNNIYKYITASPMKITNVQKINDITSYFKNNKITVL